MARVSLQDVKEIWQSKIYPEFQYVVTRNHRVLRVKKEAFASSKMMYIFADKVNFNGNGRFAHSENDPQVRQFLERVAARETEWK